MARRERSQRNLRCLVTTWGVPLRIGRDKAENEKLTRYREYLEGERTARMKLLRDMAAEFELLAPGVSPTDLPDASSAADSENAVEQESETAELQSELEIALQRAQARIRELSDAGAKQQATEKVQRYASAVGGIQVLLQSLQKAISSSTDTANSLQPDFARLRGMLIAYTEMQGQLERSAPSIERDQLILDLLTRTQGVIAAVNRIDEQLKLVEKTRPIAALTVSYRSSCGPTTTISFCAGSPTISAANIRTRNCRSLSRH